MASTFFYYPTPLRNSIQHFYSHKTHMKVGRNGKRTKTGEMQRGKKASQYTNEIVMMTTDNELDEKSMHLPNGFHFSSATRER